MWHVPIKSIHSLRLLGIIAINTAVLCCWRIPSMQRNMIKYFTSNPVSSKHTSYLLCCSNLCHKNKDAVLFFFFTDRNPMPSHDPVLLQPLLHYPHGGQHVCPMDIFLWNRLSSRKRAIPCSLSFCRYV